jgi:fibronectin-binding autotransporter adhesin
MVVFRWMLTVAFTSAAATGLAQNLLVNGSFETPVAIPATDQVLGMSSSGLAGWTVSAGSIQFGSNFGPDPNVSGGSQAVELNAARGSVLGGIEQSIPTLAGQLYTITIDARDHVSPPVATGTLYFGGQALTLSPASQSFKTLTWIVTATSASTLVNIVGNTNPNTDQLIVDNVSVALDQNPTPWSGSTSSDWGTATNWLGVSYAPGGPGVAVSFGSPATSGSVDLGTSNRTVGTVNFLNATPTTIQSSGGKYLVLDNDGSAAVISVSGRHAINSGVQLNSNAAITVTGGTDQLTFGGSIVDGAASSGLTLSGSGTLLLAGPNTYSGSTGVASGTLLLSNSLALQNSTLTTGGVAFNSSVASHAFTLGGLSGSGNIALADNAGNPVALGVGNNNSTNTFSGALSGNGSLALIGSGMLTLAGSNTFTGNTLLSGGTLVVANGAALQNSVLDASGGGALNFGTLSSGALGGLTNGGSLSPQNLAQSTVNLSVGNNGISSNFSGSLNGNVNLTKIGSGTLALTGNNGYFGTTTLSGGILQVQGNAALPGGSPIAISAGTLQIHSDGAGSNGVVGLGNNISLSVATSAVTIDVGNNGSSHTGNTVAFGLLSNGTAGDAFTSTFNFTGANGYLQSYSGLYLSGKSGGSTTLNPTTASVIIAGDVTNQEANGVSGHFDTLNLGGTTTGNVISGMISDNAFFVGVGNGDTRLTKSNNSMWTLTGANTYSGPTTISGGTLVIGGAGVLGGGNYSGAITVNGTLVMATSANQTLGGVISGGGAFCQVGSGDTTLTAANSFDGSLAITAGTLALGPAASLSQTPGITLGNGATLDVSAQNGNFHVVSYQALSGAGNYYVNGAMTANSGSFILPGGVASSGTLNVGSLTLNTGSVLKYDLVNPGGPEDLINVSGGNLNVGGGGLYLYQADGVTQFSTPGTYTIMEYSGSLGGAANNLSVLNPTTSDTYTFASAGGSLNLTIAVPDTWTGGGSGIARWSNPANWSTLQAPSSGLAVAFAGSAGLSSTNDLTNLNLIGIFFSNSAGAFNLSGNSIQLSGAIADNSAATETIGMSIRLAGGNQKVNAAAGNLVLSGTISDGGAGLGLNTTGSVVLAAANTYSGPTNILAGTLNLAHPLAVQYSTVSPGPGSLTFAAGVVSPTLGGLSGSGNVALATVASQPVALNVGNNGQSTTYGGSLSGPGSLVKQGPGTLTLTSPQSYSGVTLINGGVLQLQPQAATGIAIHFVGNANGGSVTGPAGLVPLSNWNNLSGQSFTNQALADNSGAASTAVITVNATQTWASGSSNPVLNGYIDDGGYNVLSATISGIPYHQYSIYAYLVDSTQGYGEQFAIGGNTYYYSPLNTANYAQITNTVAGSYPTGNYVLASGLTGGSQTLAAQGISSPYASFAGFEIIGDVPGGPLLPATTPVTISNGGTLDMTNCLQTIASLSSTDGLGSQVLVGSGQLTIAGPGATMFDGTISGQGGSLVVQGGELTLTGVNTFSGGTLVEAGTLVLGSPTALADGSSLTVGQGASALFAPVAGAVLSAAASPVEMSAVPEPPAMLLLLAAAIPLAIYRKRKPC